MTGKEALEKICLHCEHYHQDMCFRAIAGCEEWHKLEKDLKVLEEMREYIKPIDYGEEYQNRYALQVGSVIYHLLMKEDYNRWVRWLGNDK